MDVVQITRSLDAATVLAAYRAGKFPMGYPGREVITWHHPRRRAILPLDQLHISRSLARTLKKSAFRVTYDEAFEEVMRGCADRDSTWITGAIFRTYRQLHRMGNAHSVEVWVDGQLAGGVYGVHIGGVFFAESKFHRVTDMSKVALVHLAERLRERGFALLEVQYWTEHLAQFGVIEISGGEYERRLEEALRLECIFP
ncbi:MAG: leucyl/phenylalanyl-tRNA--protein transferase [Bryobacterales bacterium]|nr:leucyl/phenylalanyl-tRNA--protein transferase [Bryobacterales bacterium]